MLYAILIKNYNGHVNLSVLTDEVMWVSANSSFCLPA